MNGYIVADWTDEVGPEKHFFIWPKCFESVFPLTSVYLKMQCTRLITQTLLDIIQREFFKFFLLVTHTLNLEYMIFIILTLYPVGKGFGLSFLTRGPEGPEALT